MIWLQIRRALAVAAAGTAMVCAPVMAQELTQREKDMMVVIEALKERVTALEEKAAETSGAPAEDGTALVERVEALEKSTSEGGSSEPNDFRVYWKSDKGISFETNDGRIQLQFGGRIHNDWYWFDQDKSLQRMVDLEDSTELRRARMNFSGTLHENLKFKAEYDFADGDADFKDVYLELVEIPVVQNLRIGQFKEPFSLEELTSSNDATFMERALPNIFAPSRSTGAMIHGAFLGEKKHERMTAALGVFRASDDYGNDAGDGEYSGTVRVTGLPWYKEGGRQLVHLGASYTHRNPDDTIRLRQRPESHDSARFVDTGDFEAEDIDAFVLEGALVYGPFSLQGEYFMNSIDTRYLGDRDFDGYYAQASYFLTGEHRPYKNSGGVFDRVKPKRNFKFHGEEQGWGAWEVALRYSKIDLEDGHTSFFEQVLGIDRQIWGGEEDNITVGLNWYLNPNARVMLNYINADIDSRVYRGDLNIFQTRFQLAF